ncbi:MAG: PDZ domain-containing protein [Myxococcales bacterium]|nr:PDZ domain-containing protein [Myxococcales bacterium]
MIARTFFCSWLLLLGCSGSSSPGIGNGGGQWAGGIGAVLRHRANAGSLVLVTVPPEGGAGRAGLRAGDEVLSIDGVEVRGLSARSITERLQGQVGTRVRLGIRRDAGAEEVSVERGPYQRGAAPASRGH